MEELMLKVDHVSKEYRLGTIGGGTLKGELQSKFAKLRKKEDPNLKIGEKSHDKNERFLALDDVSFTIKKGERIGIIGHNGAGKSTVLKLICRVTAPTKGNIFLNGRITSMLEVGTGFHNELTGRENVYLNGAILGMSKQEIDERFDEIVEFSEIGQFIDTPVKRYSSGMKVKLGFSVASHLNSEIMIMDEVLAVGDMAFQKKCLDQMSKLADDEGRTILYVSHNMNTIRSLCDKCIVMEHGKLCFFGDVEEAISIYLNTRANEEVYVDCSQTPREWLPEYTAAKIKYAEYVGKTNNTFIDGEKIKVKLVWQNNEKIEDMCLRVELLDTARNPVATSCFRDFYSGESGKEGAVVFVIDPYLLSSGKYTMNYVLYSGLEHGQNSDIDYAYGLYFDYKKEEKIIWNNNKWGRIEYPGIKIIEVK